MKVLLVICGLFAIASAAVFQSAPSTSPGTQIPKDSIGIEELSCAHLILDHPGKCYFPEEKVAVSPGETYDVPGQCIQYRCNADFSFSGATCGLVRIDPPCKPAPIDLSKPYPECCAKAIC